MNHNGIDGENTVNITLASRLLVLSAFVMITACSEESNSATRITEEEIDSKGLITFDHDGSIQEIESKKLVSIRNGSIKKHDSSESGDKVLAPYLDKKKPIEIYFYQDMKRVGIRADGDGNTSDFQTVAAVFGRSGKRLGIAEFVRGGEFVGFESDSYPIGRLVLGRASGDRNDDVPLEDKVVIGPIDQFDDLRFETTPKMSEGTRKFFFDAASASIGGIAGVIFGSFLTFVISRRSASR